MQKTSLSLAILTSILMIIFLIQPLAQMAAVRANPYSFIKPHISVLSPIYYKGEVYQETSIPINVEAFPGPQIDYVEMYCNLDGGPDIKLNLVTYKNSAAFFGRGIIDNVTNGYHVLSAYCKDAQGNTVLYEGKTLSGSITFLVNNTFRFPTLLFSPNNSTYAMSKEIPLTYSINNSSQYSVSYQLDNSIDTVHLTGNTSLSGLSEGQHTITARAYDIRTGELYSHQTVNFSIGNTNPSPVPTSVPEFSWLAILSLFLSIFSITVILRHRKTTKFNQ